MFPVKGQRLSVFFAKAKYRLRRSYSALPLQCESHVNELSGERHGCVPIKPYSQKQEAARIWPVGCSSPTPTLSHAGSQTVHPHLQLDLNPTSLSSLSEQNGSN